MFEIGLIGKVHFLYLEVDSSMNFKSDLLIGKPRNSFSLASYLIALSFYAVFRITWLGMSLKSICTS